jgi:hypothetical protein
MESNSEQDHLFEGAGLDPSPSELSPQHTNGESAQSVKGVKQIVTVSNTLYTPNST